MRRGKKSSLALSEIPQILFVTFAVALSWLIFAGAFNIQEGIAAILAGVATATGGYTLRVLTGHRQIWLARWLRYLPGIILRGLADCWKLTIMLFRMLSGYPSNSKFQRIPYETGSDDPDDTGRRILTVMGITLQPNSYVADFNKDKNEVLIHQLDPTADIPIAEELGRPE